MNFAPLLLILLYFWKNNPSWLKNVLPRLDLPSFAPLFKILGLNDKTVSFLTSENSPPRFPRYSITTPPILKVYCPRL